MALYAMKCPKCRWAQGGEIKKKGTYAMKCRKCGRSTKLIQYPKDGSYPFQAFIIKGPFDRDVLPKAIAAWNRRTFGPKLAKGSLDNYVGEKP